MGQDNSTTSTSSATPRQRKRAGRKRIAPSPKSTQSSTPKTHHTNDTEAQSDDNAENDIDTQPTIGTETEPKQYWGRRIEPKTDPTWYYDPTETCTAKLTLTDQDGNDTELDPLSCHRPMSTSSSSSSSPLKTIDWDSQSADSSEHEHEHDTESNTEEGTAMDMGNGKGKGKEIQWITDRVNQQGLLELPDPRRPRRNLRVVDYPRAERAEPVHRPRYVPTREETPDDHIRGWERKSRVRYGPSMSGGSMSMGMGGGSTFSF